MAKTKKNCTPEEMSQALHKLTLRWDPLEEILNRPRNRCIAEPIPGKKMKVVPLKARAGRSDLIHKMPKGKIKFGDSEWMDVYDCELTILDPPMKSCGLKKRGHRLRAGHEWAINFYNHIIDIKRVARIIEMKKSNPTMADKKIIRFVNRGIRRQKVKRFINRLTPLSIAIGSAVVSIQLLLLSLKLSGIIYIGWDWVCAPMWMPGACLIGWDIGVWIGKGIREK